MKKNNNNYGDKKILNANKEWENAIKKETPDFFKRFIAGQQPETLWIGCSESRMPETLITGSQPGDIFVHRNI